MQSGDVEAGGSGCALGPADVHQGSGDEGGLRGRGREATGSLEASYEQSRQPTLADQQRAASGQYGFVNAKVGFKPDMTEFQRGYEAAWDISQQYMNNLLHSRQRAWQLEGFIYGMVSMGLLALVLVMITYLATQQIAVGDPDHWLLCRVYRVCLS